MHYIIYYVHIVANRTSWIWKSSTTWQIYLTRMFCQWLAVSSRSFYTIRL